jgi:hypothetical protein
MIFERSGGRGWVDRSHSQEMVQKRKLSNHQELTVVTGVPFVFTHWPDPCLSIPLQRKNIDSISKTTLHHGPELQV